MDQRRIDFIEEMSRHLEGEGVPRIGGRLYAFLLTGDASFSLEEMAEKLSASKTSVSTNARLLEQRGLVRRVSKPGDRRDYYAAAPDQTRSLELAIGRVREMSRLLRSGAALRVASKPPVRARLQTMIEFNDEALEVIEELLVRWAQDRA